MPFTLSPLRYPGGKTGIYKYIKELVHVNDVRTYIEPFAGGSGVALSLLLNGDVDEIIINDIDPSIYSFWYSVKHFSSELIASIEECDITMTEWEKQKEIQMNQNAGNPLELGFSTLFLNRTNRSGIIKGGVIGGKDQTGKYKLDCRFTKATTIKKIRAISAVSDQIRITNLDAQDFIEQEIVGRLDSLTFFDPPYFNKGPALYTNFYCNTDHLNLAKRIREELAEYKWIVTYDHCPEIKEMYRGLQSINYYLTYSAQRKRRGMEYMFFSDCINQGDYQEFLQLERALESIN
nr:DNA adenine methylase [Sporolactobacillus terrae]